VGALAGDFPYYGEAETNPPEGWQRFLRGEGAVVEETMLLQFGVSVGDEIKVGNLTLPIVGALVKVPGDNEFFASLAPRVYLRMDKLDATGLIGEFSLARYRRYFAFDSEAEAEAAIRAVESKRRELRLRIDTVEERKEDLGEALQNLYRFLNLGGFVALLLGAIGIASAIQVHIRQRLDSVAMLRCLGATARQAFIVYLIQGAALGLAGVVVGTALGVALQQTLPWIFADLIPVEVKFSVDAASVLRAAAAGRSGDPGRIPPEAYPTRGCEASAGLRRGDRGGSSGRNPRRSAPGTPRRPPRVSGSPWPERPPRAYAAGSGSPRARRRRPRRLPVPPPPSRRAGRPPSRSKSDPRRWHRGERSGDRS
jgi:hypothetical protein